MRGDGVLYPLNSVSQFNLINRPKKEIWFTDESHGKNSVASNSAGFFLYASDIMMFFLLFVVVMILLF
ncbi:hypothetical protein AO401_13660 [Salmonella enterica]|nr:hypothetical protein [Salmonella enterica]